MNEPFILERTFGWTVFECKEWAVNIRSYASMDQNPGHAHTHETLNIYGNMATEQTPSANKDM